MIKKRENGDQGVRFKFYTLQMRGGDTAATNREEQEFLKLLIFQNMFKLHGMVWRGSLSLLMGYHT